MSGWDQVNRVVGEIDELFSLPPPPLAMAFGVVLRTSVKTSVAL